MKQKTLLSIMAVLLSLTAFSGPARRGPVCLDQPDGTTFSARIKGDEFMKIVTTADGNALIQDADGWWCYAQYDAEGRKSSSGYRVGGDVPSEVILRSRNIPYSRLAANAKAKRAEIPGEELPIMKRISGQQGIGTKSGVFQPVTKHGIIILAQFKDVSFRHGRDAFVDMLTKSGYNVNGATGSAKEYFDAQFNGAFEFSFDVSQIVTLTSDMAHYGANDKDKDDQDTAPEDMIYEACELADADVDFSLYDDDRDGYVDNVFVFFAGGDEAEGAGDDCIWSHAWYIESGAGKRLVLDGKRIDRYACTAELSRRYISETRYNEVLAGIGTFCHEYFHTFGIPDMYDTDYDLSGGRAACLWGATSLMDSGNQNNYGNTPPYLNAIERELLGISEPEIITENGAYALDPINRSGKYYRLNTDYEDEYYLIECRGEENWDRYCGGSGMLVYHIDKSDRDSGHSESFEKNLKAAERWEPYNEVNCRPDHQCTDLVEADGRQEAFAENELESLYISQSDIRGIFLPNGNTTALYPDRKPGLKYWSGKRCEFSITDIRKTNSGVAFNIVGVSKFKVEPFSDAAIINFENDGGFNGTAIVKWGRTGGMTESISVSPYSTGKYSVTLEGLLPNRTYTATIYYEQDGILVEVKTLSFMTKKTPSVNWPYIYMGGITPNSDGTLPAGTKLPLRIYNAKDAAEIIWKFNDRTITAGGDGYFTVSESGILKAYLVRHDGTEEIMMKEITIGKEEQ